MQRFLIRTLFCVLGATGLWAQQTEVVLSASSSAKLVLGMTTPKLTAAPKAAPLDEASVATEFTAVLKRDLDETGVFAVLQERLPTDGAPAKAWKEAGAQWLLNLKFNKLATGDLQLEATALDTAAEKGAFSKTFNADKIVPLRYLAHSLADELVGRLTDGTCINTEPSWNPNGTQIAFTSDREGAPQVFLMQDDGSNLRRLTGEGLYNASPSWSPNGAMVAYVSRFEGKFDLFVYKLGEGKAYQITTGVSTSESPAWSPDERRLVFTSNRFGTSQLFTTDLSGRQIVRLAEFAGCQSPRWIRGR